MSKNGPRKSESYRWARRNSMRRGDVWAGFQAKRAAYVPIYLNRSKWLPVARSYMEAREIASEALAR